MKLPVKTERISVGQHDYSNITKLVAMLDVVLNSHLHFFSHVLIRFRLLPLLIAVTVLFRLTFSASMNIGSHKRT